MSVSLKYKIGFVVEILSDMEQKIRIERIY